MTDLKAISLYSGAGGLDYGFEAAGIGTAVALEVDPDCCATLRRNRPWPIIADDIADVPTERLLSVAGLKAGEADLLIGGPPCQPFSKSGYWASGDSGRLLDPRASTLGAFLRVLREAQPRAFLLENVEGLGYRGKTEGLSLIQETIAAINNVCGSSYRPSVAVLNAADYGVPQMRRRLFVVAGRDGAHFRFPQPTHADRSSDFQMDSFQPHITAWDALHDLPGSSNEDLGMKGRWADLLPSIPEGQNYLWHTDRMGGLPLFGWRRRFWSFLLKLAKDRPAWTLQAQPGPATGPFHWSNRRLSVREMCRLQTFPNDIEIVGTYGSAQRQIGNAVPSLLAEVLGREIRRQLLASPAATGSVQLAIDPARIPVPPAEPVAQVPAKYLALRGTHQAHPGTGRGPGARRRPPAEKHAELPLE
ncbi:MAG: DNA cytosine methyltransferase [Proteobacteria bacterium]|nr:DNA cytosine methyltransferase [Pseudomonadota bacterium]MBI3497393.1 DNA cytosine methyltransferase [Pseudomonadota bacterium]